MKLLLRSRNSCGRIDTFEIDDARDVRDDRRFEAMPDVVRIGAAAGHFV